MIVAHNIVYDATYPMKLNEDVIVRLVRPGTLEGIKVQAKNRLSTKGTWIRI